MGLDMYLYMHKYESAHRYNIESGKKLPKNFYPKELEQLKQDILEHNFLRKETKYQVGYWRKFNALHWWMVKNYANGKDDCREIYLSVKGIEELLKICQEVAMDHSKASELLPTKEGFFFGDTKYGEWYFREIEYTIDLLQKVIGLTKKQAKKKHSDSAVCSYGWDIIYQASW
jgi:hypothetical protein